MGSGVGQVPLLGQVGFPRTCGWRLYHVGEWINHEGSVYEAILVMVIKTR